MKITEGSITNEYEDFPPKIHAAAIDLHNFMSMQGRCFWEFTDVADRALVIKLRKALEPYCKHEEATRWPNGWVQCNLCHADIPQVEAPTVCADAKPEAIKGGAGQVGGTHYAAPVAPWDLQQTMQTSGDAFVDARRADAIKYAWRKKGGDARMLEDLKKAAHCLAAAIQRLETTTQEPTQ